MKTKVLSHWLGRTLFIMAGVLGVFLMLPNYGAFAMPLSITYDCASQQSQIPQTQCEALVALFHNTTGTGWTNKTGWLQTSTPCSWFGVNCVSNTNVTSLTLSSNNLAGPLPTELSNLTTLTSLDLSGNQLTNAIPTGLGGLTALTNLDLGGNRLTGSIPTELGALTALTHLDLNGNSLTGSIPTQLGSLLQLQLLDLSGNQLSGSIPKQLGYLTPLQFLYLDDNQLTGSIPVLLGSLHNLVKLNLANNLLSGLLPTELGGVTSLTDLYLGSNQLSGEIPVSFTALTNLGVGKLSLSCGLTSTDTTVIAFINGILGPGWDVACPVNDDFDNATAFSTSGQFLVDASLATKAGDDPTFAPCVSDQGTNSVWYSYTPPSARVLTLDTFGSTYDTMLAIWTGSRGSLASGQVDQVDCNDDSGGVQSKLVKTVYPGQTYYIEVAGYHASGNLVFNVAISQLPTPTITRTPTITPTGPTPTLTPTPTIVTTQTVFTSNAAEDGWVLESGEHTSIGHDRNNTSVDLLLGDDGQNRQYSSILSFTTGSLPNTAVITKVTLVVTRHKFVGGEPVTLFQGFIAEIKKGFFDTEAALQSTDFQAPASAKWYGPFSPNLINNTYSIDLTSAKNYINKLSVNSALTQIRLHFKREDNDNDVTNTLNLFSANATLDTNRPKLIIRYYVP